MAFNVHLTDNSKIHELYAQYRNRHYSFFMRSTAFTWGIRTHTQTQTTTSLTAN